MVYKEQKYSAVGPLEEISKMSQDLQRRNRAGVHLL